MRRLERDLPASEGKGPLRQITIDEIGSLCSARATNRIDAPVAVCKETRTLAASPGFSDSMKCNCVD